MPVRIVGLADSFDAMTSARPYRAPLSVGSALSDLVRMAPEKFDPNVVQASADSSAPRCGGQQPNSLARHHACEHCRHRHRSSGRHPAAQSLARKDLSDLKTAATNSSDLVRSAAPKSFIAYNHFHSPLGTIISRNFFRRQGS